MYEDQTYEKILDRSLGRVADNVDKREGSLVMNAIAPVSAEHTNIYMLLDSAIKNGYADTADIREFLVYRCKERGIYPHEATQAVLKGRFNMQIPLGSRFSLDELNYTAKEYIGEEHEGEDTFYLYQMVCETLGTSGNKFFGAVEPIEYIHKDLEGELVELLIPAEDEEDTEALRERYLSSFNSNPFGGNKQDYHDKVVALDGVGGCVVVPVWNGGGTVKLIIIDSEYNRASSTLVARVQNEIDPPPQGTGIGIAPIGHTVTVASPDNLTVRISSRITLNEGYSWNMVKAQIDNIMGAYFLELRRLWDKENLVIRIAQVENRILNLDGVLDIADTTLNGVAGNLNIAEDKLPIYGEVENRA